MLRFSRLSISLFLVLSCLISLAYAQPESDQEWQSTTIASGAITISCAQFVMPPDVGRPLSEPNPATTCGEMCASFHSAFPVPIKLQPESGTSDDLTTISGCSIDGTVIQLSTEDTGDTITVKDSGAGQTGSIQLIDDLDFVIDTTNKILTLKLKAGAWVPVGGGGGSTGNLILGEGQRIDASGITGDSATEGLFITGQTNCSSMIGLDQLCYDTDDNVLYVGTGSAIVAVTSGGCTDSENCFANTITNIDTTPFIIKDTNGDGYVFTTGAGGPEANCTIDIGGTDTPCTPSEIKTIGFLSGWADESQCFRQFDVTLNDLNTPVGYYCVDNDSAPGGEFYFKFPMPDRWDGVTAVVFGFLHTNEATPAGDLNYDWVGFCTGHNDSIVDSAYPTATANSEMVIDLDGLSGTDRESVGETVGNIPLSGCTSKTDRTLWLKATMDETSSTVDNWSQQTLFDFKMEYGLSTNTDE